MGRKIPVWQTAICLLFTLGSICYAIFLSEGEAHMALILSAALVCIVGVINGYKWSYLEASMIAGINRSMQANLILLTVGMLVATWKAGGIIPSMIYYGLGIISPGIFLVTAAILCTLISLVIGSSYTTAGTIGVALIGIAVGLGINPAMAAGAVVSGAYCGDKMSPMSDTTNMAPAVAGANIFDHIRHMVYTVTPSYIIMIVVFLIIGRGNGSGTVEMELGDILKEEILKEFSIVSPLLLIPVILLLVAVIMKVPAIPAMFIGVVMGMICMAIQGLDFSSFFGTMHYGYEAASEVQLTDDYSVASIIGGGGFDGMLWTVSIVLCSMSLSGALEGTGMLQQLLDGILKIAKTNGLLIMCTILTCILVNVLCADQYLSIILPGRMYKRAFEDRKLAPKNLSRCLEDAGTLSSPMIPWNVCGTTMTGFLGVPTAQYAPYAVLNYVCPLISMIYGFTGFSIVKMTDKEYEKAMADRAEEEARALKGLADE